LNFDIDYTEHHNKRLVAAKKEYKKVNGVPVKMAKAVIK